MGLFSRKNTHHKAGQVDKSRLPRHIAIIMDGNGRWAKKRGLPRTAGHKVGAEVFRKIALYCKALGVEYVTVYAFSTENWKRPQDEVNTLMSLLKKYILEAIDTMERDQMRLRFFGDLSALSPELRLSNFLLWQCAYSEFYFCDTLWPDFTEKDLDEAIMAYQQRDRRFGGVK